MTAAVPLALAALAYLVAARRVPGWPLRRSAAWMAGLAVLAVCLAGLDAAAGRRLSAHMLQHAGLTLLAPPLLLLGAPARLALRASSRSAQRALAAALSGRIPRALCHPLVAWALFCGTLLATHLTGVYGLALRSPLVHALEHAAYFWTGVLFWLPLVAAAPVPHRLGPVGALAYLMTAMPVMVAIALWLGSGTLRYPAYAGPGALADQHAAAAMMLASGALAMLAAALGPGAAPPTRTARAPAARPG
jgi:cytochrome c oxidase assembly factor CtaG